MLSHTCKFDDAAALAALAEFAPGGAWDESRVIAGQSARVGEDVWSYESDPPVLVSAAERLPGYLVTIQLDQRREDLPGLVLIRCNNSGAAVYVATGCDAYAAATIEPGPAGAHSPAT